MALRLTEQPSLHDNLEKKSVAELLREINEEDKKVPVAIEAALPEIEKLVTAIEKTIRQGGRMFYLGCGTGGKLAVLDILEVPNTYGVNPEIWQAVLAGGVENLVLDLEEAEDDVDEGWRTLTEKHHITPKDIVVGISASGCTPYVEAAMKACKEHGFIFVNVAEAVMDDKGNLTKSLCLDPNYMGLHLNYAGCEVWVDYLKSHVA